MKILAIVMISFMLIGNSCTDSSTSLMKNVTGKAGELVVVMPKKTWEGDAGKAIRRVLSQPQLALPQDEPLFDLISVPPNAFQEIFKTTRNIVTVKISSTFEKPVIEFKRDVWARPQAVINLKASSVDEFESLFKDHSDKILSFFLKAEKDRQMGNYRKYYDKAAYNIIKKKFDIGLYLPPGFKVVDQTKDYAWVKYETPEISQGIIIHTYKYESDSTFTLNFLENKRDSILKAHVPGPSEGSYMATESQIDPVLNIFKFKGNYAAEMRGLWKVENDYMGGPFVSLTALDASNNRVVTLDGYVYAPRYDKRNYLRQVEAMIYSMEFPNQAKNDKITSQIEMGN